MPIDVTPITPTPIALPSYLTVEQARQLLAGLPGLAALQAATDEQLARVLPIGSLRLDNSGRWQGGKLDCTQDLEFPRDWLPTVPLNVKLATLYECDSMLANAGQPTSVAPNVKREKTGSAEVEYFEPTAANGVAQICPDAARLIAKYRLKSGSLK